MKKIAILLLGVIWLTGCGKTQTDLNKNPSTEEYHEGIEDRDIRSDSESDLNTETEDQTKEETENSSDNLEDYLVINNYFYYDITGTWYLMEITNTSAVTVSVSTNVIGKDSEGNVVGADSNNEKAIESGFTVCVPHGFSDVEVTDVEYTINAKEETFYKPVLSDLSYEVFESDKKVIITCTNNGDLAAELVTGRVIFFLEGEVVKAEAHSFFEDGVKLNPNSSLSEEFTCRSEYDEIKVYFSGNRW
ncbi:MAG: hypothetical protein J1E83_14305 [Lachnospiraceae bacterium]|nr:hypothetical protein [Lachnospiraceae bacterium]